MSFLKSIDNFLDCLFIPERIRNIEKFEKKITNHSDYMSLELGKVRNELDDCRRELQEYQKLAIRYGCLTPKSLEETWRDYEEKTSKQVHFTYMSKEKQKALADRLAREYASRIFSPEHNVFSDSWQYYRVGFVEGFIKVLELIEKGAGA